jgi:two-component system, response regulator PdtaR
MIALEACSPSKISWALTISSGDNENFSSQENQVGSAMRSLRVLVVEDEFFISLHMKELLETLGHTVVAIAVSAEEAVAIASTERPDVVLMDIRLIGPRDGIDAANEIRRRFGIGSIFVTANTDPDTRKRAQAAQPIAFLEKPITEHRLRFGLGGLR